MNMTFVLSKLTDNVWSILEQDTRGCNPFSYLIQGDEKVLLVDTGCGCGNIYSFVKSLEMVKDRKIVVVNTHNHPEQTGGNWRFSTTGKYGLAHQVDDLCASKRHKYYTRLMESSWHWEVGTYKVTRWLNDGDSILLGPEENLMNVVQAMWTPGHTPDSLVLWYPYGNRLFTGDLCYRFDDIMFTYAYTDIRDFEASVRKVLRFVKQQPDPRVVRYSASKNDSDEACLPTFQHFHRFLMAVLAGTHIGTPLREVKSNRLHYSNSFKIDDAEGWRFETRDKAMRLVIGRQIVRSLNEAREKAQQYR